MSVDGTVVQRIGREQTREFLAAISQAAPWETWAEKLVQRKRPESLPKLFPVGAYHPLDWSVTIETEPATVQLVRWLSVLPRRPTKGEKPSDWSSVISEWLETIRARSHGESLAIECVAMAGALPRLALRLDDAKWAELFAELVNISVDAIMEVAREDADGMVESQLLAGELPLTLDYMFPKIELCQRLGQRGAVVIDEGLLKVLDGEGMPHVDFVPAWHRLLACWTRCVAMNQRRKSPKLSPDARLQFEWLVRQTLRWRSGLENLPMARQSTTSRVLDSLVQSALEVAGDKVDRELLLVSQGKVAAENSEYALPQPGEHSEWSELAVLRTDWTRRAVHLTTSFNCSKLDSQLSVGATSVWNGQLMPEIRIDGKQLSVDGSFEETCWSSDDDVDYLELELALSGGWTFQRQLMVDRHDRILLMADVVLGTQRAQIEYRLPIPLDSGLECETVEEHTEIQLTANKKIGWAIPLALSEWKLDRNAGSFDGRVLRQNAHAKGLYAPLFFDFEPKRRNKRVTWRQLTVVENLELLPRDVAVAYRIQIGAKQWVVYRSLGVIGNRTFIGQNLISEFLVAKLNKSGEIHHLIEIEGE